LASCPVGQATAAQCTPREQLGGSLHETQDAFAARLRALRAKRPGDFVCGPDEYWSASAHAEASATQAQASRPLSSGNRDHAQAHGVRAYGARQRRP
jgi:hypothetical protein